VVGAGILEVEFRVVEADEGREIAISVSVICRWEVWMVEPVIVVVSGEKRLWGLR
jgi:hypothetical protein